MASNDSASLSRPPAPGDEMTEERRLELLKRVLQYDVEDAIGRYEAEAGCCITDLHIQLEGNEHFQMDLRTDPRAPRSSVLPPVPRMIIFNFGR